MILRDSLAFFMFDIGNVLIFLLIQFLLFFDRNSLDSNIHCINFFCAYSHIFSLFSFLFEFIL